VSPWWNPMLESAAIRAENPRSGRPHARRRSRSGRPAETEPKQKHDTTERNEQQGGKGSPRPPPIPRTPTTATKSPKPTRAPGCCSGGGSAMGSGRGEDELAGAPPATTTSPHEEAARIPARAKETQTQFRMERERCCGVARYVDQPLPPELA
jgi:hypothetical protein